MKKNGEKGVTIHLKSPFVRSMRNNQLREKYSAAIFEDQLFPFFEIDELTNFHIFR